MDYIMHTILIPSEPTSSSNRFDWEWAPLLLQCLAKAALRLVFRSKKQWVCQSLVKDNNVFQACSLMRQVKVTCKLAVR